ncbi:hypothetical protein AK812_SmicGene8310 [Symbiodinium microadriaticum]|uniref:Uncharacterized protein n=1 Tax=Symbiodinium microadriaticum TaxID=2951 RepID=A0A1Q9EL85_SYMMI|nr:hypothetical protein AK812_SmicGene8310 [Symbiodinium microadriaticum]
MTYWIFEAYLPSWWAVSWKLTYHGDRRLLEVVRVMVAWFWKCRRCRLVKKGSLNGLMKFETLRVVRLGPAAANKLGQGTAGDLKAPLAEWTRTEEGEEIAYKRKQQWSESEANGRNRPAGEWRGGGRGEEARFHSGNSTIAFVVLSTALSSGFNREYVAVTAADYSVVEQQLQCTCGRFKKKRWSLQENAEPVGEQMGKTLSQFSATSVIRHWSSIRREWSESRKKACHRCAWDEHVKEIAGRSMSVDQLLDFYAKLGSKRTTGELRMTHFDPARSTTTDVVRHVVIPESRCGDTGKALAEVVQSSSRTRCLPSSSSTVRMVTHHWANRFRDLVAAVAADSLGLKRWDSIADELSSGREEALRSRLQGQGALNWEYWICAFCINQHASICDVAMGALDTVTGEPLPTCDCATPKYLNDSPVQCELNKFDSMMAYLHHRYRQRFLQVVATDKSFNLFSRAWCIAELVQEENSAQLESLRVEDCSASRPEDKEGKEGSVWPFLLEKEIEEFNRRLPELLLGSEGLFAGWKDAQVDGFLWLPLLGPGGVVLGECVPGNGSNMEVEIGLHSWAGPVVKEHLSRGEGYLSALSLLRQKLQDVYCDLGDDMFEKREAAIPQMYERLRDVLS